MISGRPELATERIDQAELAFSTDQALTESHVAGSRQKRLQQGDVALAQSHRFVQIADVPLPVRSPRKRFDRARKLNPGALVSLDFRDGGPTSALKALGTDGVPGPVQAVFDAFMAE